MDDLLKWRAESPGACPDTRGARSLRPARPVEFALRLCRSFRRLALGLEKITLKAALP
jgi:hypothetical protein